MRWLGEGVIGCIAQPFEAHGEIAENPRLRMVGVEHPPLQANLLGGEVDGKVFSSIGGKELTCNQRCVTCVIGSHLEEMGSELVFLLQYAKGEPRDQRCCIMIGITRRPTSHGPFRLISSIAAHASSVSSCDLP